MAHVKKQAKLETKKFNMITIFFNEDITSMLIIMPRTLGRG